MISGNKGKTSKKTGSAGLFACLGGWLVVRAGVCLGVLPVVFAGERGIKNPSEKWRGAIDKVEKIWYNDLLYIGSMGDIPPLSSKRSIPSPPGKHKGLW